MGFFYNILYPSADKFVVPCTIGPLLYLEINKHQIIILFVAIHTIIYIAC